jgi:hypothetical protein
MGLELKTALFSALYALGICLLSWLTAIFAEYICPGSGISNLKEEH